MCMAHHNSSETFKTLPGDCLVFKVQTEQVKAEMYADRHTEQASSPRYPLEGLHVEGTDSLPQWGNKLNVREDTLHPGWALRDPAMLWPISTGSLTPAPRAGSLHFCKELNHRTCCSHQQLCTTDDSAEPDKQGRGSLAERDNQQHGFPGSRT